MSQCVRVWIWILALLFCGRCATEKNSSTPFSVCALSSSHDSRVHACVFFCLSVRVCFIVCACTLEHAACASLLHICFALCVVVDLTTFGAGRGFMFEFGVLRTCPRFLWLVLSVLLLSVVLLFVVSSIRPHLYAPVQCEARTPRL